MCLVNPFVGTLSQVGKVVFKIIEGVIRALIEVTFTLATYAAVGTSCMIVTALFIRYGVCRDGTCFNEGLFGNFVIVAGFTLAIFGAYKLYKRMP